MVEENVDRCTLIGVHICHDPNLVTSLLMLSLGLSSVYIWDDSNLAATLLEPSLGSV